MASEGSSERRSTRVESSAKRVRVMLGGHIVADSTHAKLVWERPQYPTYYFPEADVRTGLLAPTGDVHRSQTRGPADVHTVKVGDREAEGAVSSFSDSPVEEIRGHLRFQWDAFDAWFEEDEQVFVHPRDPYTRLDVLQSSRHVRVEVDGVTVAETRNPTLLFETGLPPRFYIPKTDVRMDLLSPTDHHSQCPYKGTASYYDLTVNGTRHQNFVWWYPQTTLEVAKIAGKACFYNERVDLYLDEELQDRPSTHFS